MSNTSRGQSTIVVARIDKRWDFGLGAGFSYANQKREIAERHDQCGVLDRRHAPAPARMAGRP